MNRLLIATLLMCSTFAAAQAPQLLGYQGRLVKSDGTPESGNAQMRFGLFGTETGGVSLWEETQAVSITQGYYSTYLGRMTMFPATLFDTGTLWLEVSVQAPGDTQFRTMTPRQRVGSVAFALNARSVKGGTVDATSVAINGTQVIDANGKLTAAAGYTAGPGISIDGATRAISVNSSGCSSGQVLQWSGSAWQCATVGGAGNATSLNGVALSSTAPAMGQVLGFDGTSWAPTAAGTGGVSSIVAGTGLTGGTITSSGTIAVSFGTTGGTVAAGNDARFGNATALSGRPVAASAPDAGQVLTWNGAAWSPQALPAGSTGQSFPSSPRVLMGTSTSACQPDYGGPSLGAQNFNYGFIEFPARFPSTPSIAVGIDESLNNSGATWVRVRKGPFSNRMGVRCDYTTNAVHWFGVERGDHTIDGKHVAAGRLANAMPTNTVFFPSAFSAPPVVLVMIDESSDDNGAIHARVYNVTANGFQVNLVNTNADALHWIALDPGTYRTGRYRFVAGAHPTGGCFSSCAVGLTGFTTAPGVVLTIHDTNNNGAMVHRLFNVEPAGFSFHTWIWDPSALTPGASEFMNYVAFEDLE